MLSEEFFFLNVNEKLSNFLGKKKQIAKIYSGKAFSFSALLCISLLGKKSSGDQAAQIRTIYIKLSKKDHSIYRLTHNLLVQC